MSQLVFDSYAVLVFFRGENGAQLVQSLLKKAAETDMTIHMTEVNYAEVKYTLIKKDGRDAWAAAEEILLSLPIEFHPATRDLAELAGDFKSRYKMSLADAFTAALAKVQNADLVTGDIEFKPLAREIKIRWLK